MSTSFFIPSHKACCLGFLLSLSLTPEVAQAGNPTLTFDFGQTAECRVIAPTDTLANEDLAHFESADEKLIELKLRVSVHLLSGSIDDVEEVRIELTDCDQRIRVDSFSPNTRLDSDYSEDITVTKTKENGKSLGASLGGEVALPFGEIAAQALPSVSGDLTNREVHTEKRVRKAPHYAVVASGTIKKESGVFFKLRSSPQTTLEGSHEVTVRFVVPQNWRGDSLRVCCTATGQEKILWTKKQTTWARTCSPLAIYLSGDLQARTAAEQHIARRAM